MSSFILILIPTHAFCIQRPCFSHIFFAHVTLHVFLLYVACCIRSCARCCFSLYMAHPSYAAILHVTLHSSFHETFAVLWRSGNTISLKKTWVYFFLHFDKCHISIMYVCKHEVSLRISIWFSSLTKHPASVVQTRSHILIPNGTKSAVACFHGFRSAPSRC